MAHHLIKKTCGGGDEAQVVLSVVPTLVWSGSAGWVALRGVKAVSRDPIPNGLCLSACAAAALRGAQRPSPRPPAAREGLTKQRMLSGVAAKS